MRFMAPERTGGRIKLVAKGTDFVVGMQPRGDFLLHILLQVQQSAINAARCDCISRKVRLRGPGGRNLLTRDP
jgi:hypothetical protein